MSFGPLGAQQSTRRVPLLAECGAFELRNHALTPNAASSCWSHRQIPLARLSYHRENESCPSRTAAAEIETLYRQHGAALLLFAAAITGERSRAQDALHQVFLKLIEDGNLRDAIDKKSYLFACVRNAVLNDSKFRNR